MRKRKVRRRPEYITPRIDRTTQTPDQVLAGHALRADENAAVVRVKCPVCPRHLCRFGYGRTPYGGCHKDDLVMLANHPGLDWLTFGHVTTSPRWVPGPGAGEMTAVWPVEVIRRFVVTDESTFPLRCKECSIDLEVTGPTVLSAAAASRTYMRTQTIEADPRRV